MKKLWRDHPVLIICSAISFTFLCVFGYLQYIGSPILNLNLQWIFVAGIPVLVAMFAGGYIKKFKGFGLELESVLNKPIQTMTIKVGESMEFIDGQTKSSIGDLNNLSSEQIDRIKRLTFVQDKNEYYNTNAVHRYFKVLSKLKYVEITKSNGAFVCLIPISVFRKSDEFNDEIDNQQSVYFNIELIDSFILNFERLQSSTYFSNNSITLTVDVKEDCVTVLKKLREQNSEVAVVLSKDKKLIGIATTREIETKIADAVIYAEA